MSTSGRGQTTADINQGAAHLSEGHLSTYLGLMTRLWRLLVLLAVLLMPLGMSAAPATAHQSAHDMMAQGGCPDDGQQGQPNRAFTECTMACSTALPAVTSRSARPIRVVCTPARPSAAQQLLGLHPETATPPPKDS